MSGIKEKLKIAYSILVSYRHLIFFIGRLLFFMIRLCKLNLSWVLCLTQRQKCQGILDLISDARGLHDYIYGTPYSDFGNAGDSTYAKRVIDSTKAEDA
jgi:hypothetical protein